MTNTIPTPISVATWVLLRAPISLAPGVTVLVNLTEREMGVLNELAERKGLSKTAVMRQALRLYQAVDRRLAAGDRLVFSGDDQMKSELLPVL